MKVIGILCSPRRNGNSDRMVAAALAGAAEIGAETQTFAINEMNIKCCQGCAYCRTHEGCAVQDDMQIIYKALAEADAVVIGTPIYMWQYAAQTRILTDRLYPYISSDFTLRMQKPALLLISQGNVNPDTFAESLTKTPFVGLDIKERIIAAGVHIKGEISNQPELLARIKEAGKKLIAQEKTEC